MARNIFATICFLGVQVLFSQNNITKISLSFEESNLKSIINSIEEKSDYHFYYVEEWLVTEPISGNYENVSVNVILEKILKSTNLNYFILDNS